MTEKLISPRLNATRQRGLDIQHTSGCIFHQRKTVNQHHAAKNLNVVESRSVLCDRSLVGRFAIKHLNFGCTVVEQPKGRPEVRLSSQRDSGTLKKASNSSPLCPHWISHRKISSF